MNTIKVGTAEIRRVEEMSIRSPMSVLTQDQAIIEANKHWLMPRFLREDCYRDFVFQSWILIADGRVFVIDPCNGNGRPHVLPIFHMLDTPYIERFAATGIQPEDVDYVFCTHMHHDHCGWNTRLRDDRYVPTFPNARYLFVRREYERWDTRLGNCPPEEYGFNVGVFERSILPVVEAGLADFVGDHHVVSAGIEIEPAYGHTAGHSILHLVSRAQEAYFTGDVFHHPLQVLFPQLHLPGCDDLAQAIDTRLRLIDLCAQKNALMIPAHFPAPHMGYVRRKNGALSFEALAS